MLNVLGLSTIYTDLPFLTLLHTQINDVSINKILWRLKFVTLHFICHHTALYFWNVTHSTLHCSFLLWTTQIITQDILGSSTDSWKMNFLLSVVTWWKCYFVSLYYFKFCEVIIYCVKWKGDLLLFILSICWKSWHFTSMYKVKIQNWDHVKWDRLHTNIIET